MRGNVVLLPQVGRLADSFDAATEAFYTYQKSRNVSPRTLEYYETRIPAFTRWLDATHPDLAPKDVTSEVVREFIIHETDRKGKAMAHHAFKSLRALFNFLVNDGVLERSPMERMSIPKTPKVLIKPLTMEQVESVIATCGSDFLGLRDAAIVTVLLDCGLRATELCGLDVSDVDFSDGTLLIRCAKGDKERLVPFGVSTRQAITRYLTRRGSLPCERLFVGRATETPSPATTCETS